MGHELSSVQRVAGVHVVYWNDMQIVIKWDNQNKLAVDFLFLCVSMENKALSEMHIMLNPPINYNCIDIERTVRPIYACLRKYKLF